MLAMQIQHWLLNELKKETKLNSKIVLNSYDDNWFKRPSTFVYPIYNVVVKAMLSDKHNSAPDNRCNNRQEKGYLDSDLETSVWPSRSSFCLTLLPWCNDKTFPNTHTYTHTSEGEDDEGSEAWLCALEGCANRDRRSRGQHLHDHGGPQDLPLSGKSWSV